MPSLLKQKNIITSEDFVKIPESSPKVFVSISEEAHDGEKSDENEDDYFGENENTAENSSNISVERGKHKDNKKSLNSISKNDILIYYKDELDAIRQEEAERAYQEAVRKKRGEIAECIKQVDYRLEEMGRLQNEFMEKYAYELKYLAIEIAEKIMLQKIEENDEILKKLILSAISNEKATSWINVEMSERLISLVEELKKELEKPQYYGRASVKTIPGNIGTCRINTEEGTVVASISEQAKNLKEAYMNETV